MSNVRPHQHKPPMPELLFRVASTFQIQERGLVVGTDTPIRNVPFVLRAGSKIEYRRPDGSSMESTIKGLELLSPFNPNRPFGYLAANGMSQPIYRLAQRCGSVQSAIEETPRGCVWRLCRTLVSRGRVLATVRPNPSIEGMPKRLRLLCTPHVKR